MADTRRRQLLGAIGAAAGLPLLGQAATAPLRRVAIVGGGMAGVAAAWLLDGIADVVLLEARNSLGGNVQTLDVALDGQTWAVDMGAQYFHPGPYPTYVALLQTLGLYPPDTGGSHSFAASITVAAASESQPRFVSPVLPGRAWPLLAPWNRDGIQAFNTAFSAAEQRERRHAPWSLTLGDWLPTLGLSQAQWEGMILPWAASIFSGDIDQARSVSARAAMVFAAKALPPQATDPVVYYVLDRGMREALDRMVAQFTTVAVHTDTPVLQAGRRAGGGFTLQAAGGAVFEVDDLVLAASGPPTLALLDGIGDTDRQRAALQDIEFFDARLALHTDPAYAPAKAQQRSFLNCRVEGGFCEASMWLAPVLTPPPGASPVNLWKSWVTHRSSPPTQVLHEAAFRHLLATPATIRAQNRLRALSGMGGLWFAGGYLHPYDAQETALLSAIAVADGVGSQPSGVKSPSGLRQP